MPQNINPDSTSCKSRSLRRKLISKFTRKQRQVKLETPAVEQQTSDQSQSILFTLPFELRELIWKSVLGLRMIHLQHLDGRLGHVKCTVDTGETWAVGNHECWYHGHINIGARLPYERCPSHGHHLGILMTCRQIRDEAGHLLYTANIISIRHLHIISQFRTILPSHRLSLVTSLHLSWTIDWRAAWLVYPPVYGSSSMALSYEEPTWLNAWQLLAGFEGLKVLRVELKDYYSSSSSENRAALLNSMCCIKQVKVFEVWAVWKAVDLGFVIQEAPFTLLGSDGVIWEGHRKA